MSGRSRRSVSGAGRLWRKSDPSMDETKRVALVREMMAARRAVRDVNGDKDATAIARRGVGEAKNTLENEGAQACETHALCRLVGRHQRLVRALPVQMVG
jgi:hypothetical protein